MIRVALLATNLTCDKIVDGIGRLLLKSDVEKLKSKKLQPMVCEAEELLLGRWKDLEKDYQVESDPKVQDLWEGLFEDLPILGWEAEAREGGKGFCIFR